MKGKGNLLKGCFVLVMLVFCAAMAFFAIERASLDFSLEDVQRSLETSQGRERKQKHEYDETAAQLPLTRAELEETLPRAEAAAEETARLKAERKRLREEKKELEAARTAQEEGESP